MAKGAYIGAMKKKIPSLGEINEGNIIQLLYNGVNTEYYVICHNYESGLNGMGRTLLLQKTSMGKPVWNAKDYQGNSYAGSKLDTLLTSSYINGFSTDIQNAIGSTTFYCTVGNGDSTITTLSRAIFIMSVTEWGQTFSGCNIEGSPLPIASEVLSLLPSSTLWTRSSNTKSTKMATAVNNSGGVTSSDIRIEQNCHPCFTLPSNLGVFDDVITGEIVEPTTQSVAHKIKKGYIGILTNQSGEVETTITTDNINSYFTVTNGEYTFVGSGSIFTTTKEARAKTSTITLTALEAFPISFEYTIYSHFAQNDSFSITVAGTTVVDILCDDVRMPYTKSWSGSVNTGDAITITLTQSGRVYTGDDLKASFQKMIITQNVSKPAVEVARKIKKAYIGIGGVARPCWSGGELTYYGTITPLSEARYHLAATTIGKFALFAGGRSSISSSTGSKTVDAYDYSLIRTSPPVLGQGVSQSRATTVGNYAVFAGGRTSDGATQSVQVYDTDLVHTVPTYWLSTARYSHAAASVGNYAVFGGGYYQAPINTVEAYDSSLTKKIATELSYQVMELSATTVGNYAIFAGGRYNSTARAEVDSYDSSLTKRTLTALIYAGYNLAATTVGDYALFAGGQNSSTGSTTRVAVYDKSLTQQADIYRLGVAKYTHAATTVGNYAIFAGGYVRANSNVVATVEIFDKSLTRQDFTSLSQARQHFAAATVGDYALFGGGYGESSVISSVVDAYVVA